MKKIKKKENKNTKQTKPIKKRWNQHAINNYKHDDIINTRWPTVWIIQSVSKWYYSGAYTGHIRLLSASAPPENLREESDKGSWHQSLLCQTDSNTTWRVELFLSVTIPTLPEYSQAVENPPPSPPVPPQHTLWKGAGGGGGSWSSRASASWSWGQRFESKPWHHGASLGGTLWISPVWDNQGKVVIIIFWITFSSGMQ
jgi:hypothetical protein